MMWLSVLIRLGARIRGGVAPHAHMRMRACVCVRAGALPCVPKWRRAKASPSVAALLLELHVLCYA